MNNSFELYQSQAIDAAKDLCYGPNVIKRLVEAKTSGEIERIMRDARHGKIK